MKTATDLVSSISRGHMQDQEKRLIAHDKQAYVIVVGLLHPMWRHSGGRTIPLTIADKVSDGNVAVLTPAVGARYNRELRIDTVGGIAKSPLWTYTNYLLRLQRKGIFVLQLHSLDELGNVMVNIVKNSRKKRKDE